MSFLSVVYGWAWCPGRARAVGVCGIGATEGAGPTLPPRRAVMWGMEQISAAHRPDIVLFYQPLNNRRCAVYHLHRLVFARLFKE